MTTNNRKIVAVFLTLFISVTLAPVIGVSNTNDSVEQIHPSGAVIIPGSLGEKMFLFGQHKTWLENDARRSRGYVEYQIPMSGQLPTIIEIDAAGPYQIDISTGGNSFELLYSSGQMDGNIAGRMKRQIKLETETSPPVRIRISKRQNASDPFTLWRLAIRRQLDLYPGSSDEGIYLFEPGSSSLPQGGGRTIPAQTSIVYDLGIDTSITVTAVIEAGEGIKASNADEDIKLQSMDNLYFAQFVATDNNSRIKISAENDVKLTRTSFYFGIQMIDPTSELSHVYIDSDENDSEISLSLDEPLSIIADKDDKFIWFVGQNPQDIKVFGHDTRVWQNMVFAKLDKDIERLSVTGDGRISSFGFDHDFDDDGVPTYLELLYGSDPILSRSDNDDVGDLEDECPLDSDSDGLHDYVEEFLQISPSYPDSNSDGHPDGVGQDGFKLTNISARITDKPWPGALYQDVIDTKLISNCKKFGTTCLIIPFHEILTNREPQQKLYEALEGIGECDGFLLDNCALSESDFKNPVIIDEYQVWGKRLWTDIETDDTLAYTLNGFAQDRILELLTIAREFANIEGVHFALSVPSPSIHDLWFSPYDNLKIADRIIVDAPSIPSDGISYRAGLFDASIIGKPFFVKTDNEINTRAYISGVFDAGMYLGSAVNDERPLYLDIESSTQEKQSIFAQVIDQSTIWSKKLDKSNIHQNWQSTFSTKDINCSSVLPYELDTETEIALLDCSTTFLSPDTVENVSKWIKKGGSLLVYDGQTRFSNVSWWGDRKTLGEVLCEYLKIEKIDADKALPKGKGFIYITKIDPVFSMFTFANSIGKTLPESQCSYCQLETSSIEVDFVELLYRVTGEFPRKEYPIHIQPDFSKAPYLCASTCAVPWIGKWGKNLKILAQAPRGMCSSFAIALSDKPLSVTSNTSINWSYDSGILFVSFVASGGGDGFVVSLDEALDLASINLSLSPREPETESIVKVLATVYNSSNIPSGEFTITFHWDKLSRETQFKRMTVASLSGKSYEHINFPAPLSLAPGKHKIYMALHSDDELNDTNNVISFDFDVLEKPQYKVITMRIGSSNAFIDGVMVSLDSPPVIKNGRTMVPFRFLAESLGATVDWDGSERMVTFKKGETLIYLWIGRDYAIVGSDLVNLDSPPIIINGRTMVPLRFISETLGADVEWDGNTKTVTVKQRL